jgi:hypothetical protein
VCVLIIIAFVDNIRTTSSLLALYDRAICWLQMSFFILNFAQKARFGGSILGVSQIARAFEESKLLIS